MPFLPASTLTPSPRSSFPRPAGAEVACGEAGGAGAAGVVGVEAEVVNGAGGVGAAKEAEEAVASSRHPACRRDMVSVRTRMGRKRTSTGGRKLRVNGR